MMRRFAFALLLGGVTMAAVAVPDQAVAQGSPGYQLLDAVRDRDLNKARELLDATPLLVDTRDITTGETPLLVAMARRDLGWVNFLLGRRADVNIANRAGVTPLMLAVQDGFVDGARRMLEGGARVNDRNGSGETPLHMAVHRRDVAMTRLLVDMGANPDLTDNLAGKSPRDYASEDRRSAAVLAAITAPRTAPISTITLPVQGPQ